MKPHHIAAIAAATAMVTVLVMMPRAAATTVTFIATSTTATSTPPLPTRTSTELQEAWLKRLEMCESSGNPNAINPEDSDGTPSYGILQFKPSTFVYFSDLYGIEGELMDPEAQRAIVRRMMDDESVDWLHQFPDCVRNHVGFPPKRA